MGKAWLQTFAGLAAALALVSSDACHSPGEAEVMDAGPVFDAEAGAYDAGSGDAHTTPFTPAAMRGAADAFNTKYCAWFAKCDAVSFAFTFGTAATCMSAGGLVAISSGETRFVNELAAPYAYGSLLTPDKLRECAAALEFLTCDDWVRFSTEHVVPEACRPAFFGKLPDNSPCGVWNQCTSGRCLQEDNAARGSCGRCVAQIPVGKRCLLPACEAGSSCRRTSPTMMTCTPYADVGEPCKPNDPGRLTLVSTALPCHDYLVCEAGTCARPAGNACDPSVGCSFVPYLRYCNPATSTCDAIPFANIDEPCGYLPGPLPFVTCAYGGTCTLVPSDDDAGADAAPAPLRYVCTPVIEDGEVCTATPPFDHHCKRPDSRCFRDICQQNGPAECSAPDVLP